MRHPGQCWPGCLGVTRVPESSRQREFLLPSAALQPSGFGLRLALVFEVDVPGQLACGFLRRPLDFLGQCPGPSLEATLVLLGAPFGLELLVADQLADAVLQAACELLSTPGHGGPPETRHYTACLS